MKKQIKIEDLEIGMYVIPDWPMKLPLSKNGFMINTKETIEKIKSDGRKEVTVDILKSFIVEEVEAISHTDERFLRPPEPVRIKYRDLKKIINSEKNPEKKAGVVYSELIRIMHKLLDNPIIENIVTVKKEVYNIVDCIIDDDKMSNYLHSLTSHDFYTYTHSVNVGILGILLTKKLFKLKPEHNLRELGAGFFLHDIGKVNVDLDIINKPGRLSNEEMLIMRMHASLGSMLLGEAGQLSKECALIVLQHHEREDGRGYPNALHGQQIHPYGKICAIADVFDALTSKRSYREPLTPFEALKLMKEEMLSHFERDLFDNFVKLFV